MEADTLGNKRCPRCEQHKLVTEFYKTGPYCKECYQSYKQNNRLSNFDVLVREKLYRKKAYARKNGIPFDLVHEDMQWPVLCPVLGMELDYYNGTVDASPNLDRINPTFGYVKGNVIVVSSLANRIKSNATVDQIERVAAFYRQLIPQTGASHADQDH